MNKFNSAQAYRLLILNTTQIPFAVLKRNWTERWYPETAIQKLIQRNEDVFRFLDITASGEYCENEYSLRLTTSKFIGCIPLLSPKTGHPTNNLVVAGRFGEDISELLSILSDYIEPEFNPTYQLHSDNIVKPPLFFECQHYIDKYLEAINYKWRRFETIERIQSLPRSSTRWDIYARRSFDPAYTFKYPNRCNILTKDHREWSELNYVLDLSIREINSSRTPSRSRAAYSAKIANLINTYDKNTLPIIKVVRQHMSDPKVIKELKVIANRVLQNDINSQYAWRLDFAEFFERFVQFLFKSIARDKGARFTANPRFPIYGNRPSWALHHLEPDIIIDKDDKQYIIDAKYKSHMYNINDDSQILRDTFRADFHQVLAYSSFGSGLQKNIMLIYPSSMFIYRNLDIQSSINGHTVQAYLIGIPLRKSELESTKSSLSRLLVL